MSTIHDRLAEAVMRSLGYLCRALPTPDLKSYETGKEYQNNAYCNPAYFTVGNLVKHLLALEAEGMSRAEIVSRHVFVTAGSCGTCRFGMYEEEYQLALRNAGFDGFRVLTFGIDRSPDQAEAGAGLEANFDFFLALANALNTADVLNQLACQIRPYETRPGSTDRVLESAVNVMCRLLERRVPYELPPRLERFFGMVRLGTPARYVGKVLHQLYRVDAVKMLRRVRAKFDTVEIDPLRVRPIVKVIGEFWAQTTDGDGNFRMVRFLEDERAEAYVDRPIGTRLMYSFHMARAMARTKRGIHEGGKPAWWNLKARISHLLGYGRKQALLALAEKLYRRENRRLIRTLGGTLHEIVDQRVFRELAAPYYEWRCASGEGHLEVGENIYYQTSGQCHMVLSLKPFGCMPSTQSDGAQAAVMEDYGDLIYLPVETAGDSEVLAYSRVQMALDGARAKANQEFEQALSDTGLSIEDFQEYVDAHPELRRATRRSTSAHDAVGRAAMFVRQVAGRVKIASRRRRPPRPDRNRLTETSMERGGA
jgi:predicted nucleotide-binding protein (sugar kinase/HSP70/actin superfamily)